MAGRDPQHDHQAGGGGYLIFGLGIAAIPLFWALAMATRAMGPASIPIWFAVTGGAAYVLHGPIGKALAARIAGQAPNLPSEIDAGVFAELDELRARVGELEERVDFSERLLTKAQDEQRNVDHPV